LNTENLISFSVISANNIFHIVSTNSKLSGAKRKYILGFTFIYLHNFFLNKINKFSINKNKLVGKKVTVMFSLMLEILTLITILILIIIYQLT